MSFAFRAARNLFGDTKIVTVFADGDVTLGSSIYFRFVVEENPQPGLNAKLEFVVVPPSGIHSQLVRPANVSAELSVPTGYDRVIVISAEEENTVPIAEPPFNDWPTTINRFYSL